MVLATVMNSDIKTYYYIALLFFLIYCVSNNLDFQSVTFETKPRSVTPPPKPQEPYNVIEPGKRHKVTRLC